MQLHAIKTLNAKVTASGSVSRLFVASGEVSATSGSVSLFSWRAAHTHAAHVTLLGL